MERDPGRWGWGEGHGLLAPRGGVSLLRGKPSPEQRGGRSQVSSWLPVGVPGA